MVSIGGNLASVVINSKNLELRTHLAKGPSNKSSLNFILPTKWVFPKIMVPPNHPF